MTGLKYPRFSCVFFSVSLGFIDSPLISALVHRLFSYQLDGREPHCNVVYDRSTLSLKKKEKKNFLVKDNKGRWRS